MTQYDTEPPYRILWVSRHPPLDVQIESLRSIFGPNVEIILDQYYINSVDELRDRFEDSGCDDMMIVAPLSVLRKLCKTGIYPLFSIMNPATPETADTVNSGRYYRFIRFVRVADVRLDFCSIQGGIYGTSQAEKQASRSEDY